MIQFTIPESVRLTPAGAVLALGTLTFYFTGASALAPVYTDDTLTTELDNPVAADADGVWADIWLDPEAVYRVILADANGVMQYDNPEYVPYASGAFQYLDAQTRAYSAGALVPGAELTFTLEGDPVPLYADADGLVALPNPVTADSGGLFPAIYLESGEVYGFTGYLDGAFPPVAVVPVLTVHTLHVQGSAGSGNQEPHLQLSFGTQFSQAFGLWGARRQPGFGTALYVNGGLVSEPFIATGEWWPDGLADQDLYEVKMVRANESASAAIPAYSGTFGSFVALNDSTALWSFNATLLNGSGRLSLDLQIQIRLIGGTDILASATWPLSFSTGTS